MHVQSASVEEHELHMWTEMSSAVVKHVAGTGLEVTRSVCLLHIFRTLKSVWQDNDNLPHTEPKSAVHWQTAPPLFQSQCHPGTLLAKLPEE